MNSDPAMQERRKVIVMRISFRNFVLAALAAGCVAAPINAQAASECKGLEQPVCENHERCSWVNGYKTSKGREVSSFCRKKPERKKSSQSQTPEKKS
jgi:hypothetical protein